MHVVPTPPSYLNDKNISEQTPWLTWIVKNDELRDFDTQKKFSYTGRGQKKKVCDTNPVVVVAKRTNN
jgi:hypothetical protein